jgi:hypothetical protein
MKLWLNVADAAEHAGVCRDTIYTAVERGEPGTCASAAVDRFASRLAGSTSGWRGRRRSADMKVTFPDNTIVEGSALRRGSDDATAPDFGLYLDHRWAPTWPHDTIEWADYGLPTNSSDADSKIRAAFARARAGEHVEVGCLGGTGRTGTVLACMAVLSGVPAAEAIEWVRQHYKRGAVETPAQEKWVTVFASTVIKP